MKQYGKVYLVGAGPGDPKLITIRGKELIQDCDVILYDKLANTELLHFAKSNSELVFVGKEAGKHYASQEEIISLIIKYAKTGKSVLRLKGGDPLIFGRGSEEALALKKENIEFEIVPGITAASGATTYAGMPLTHRNSVTQCIFLTAHESPDKKESQVEWEHIAQMKHTTTVIYMGARMLPKITDMLIEYGMPVTMPCAIIENGTLTKQRTITGNISNIALLAEENNFKPPLITVISPNIDMHKDLDWFSERALRGKRIAVTRALDQAFTFTTMLREEGADVISFPLIKSTLASSEYDYKSIPDKKYDWIAFTSENGVRFFFESLRNQGLDSRVLAGVKIAAIGTGTQRKLEEYNLLADFIPSEFTSEAMAIEMNNNFGLMGTKILRVKGYFKQDPFTDNLRKKMAEVDPLPVYQLETAKPELEAIEKLTRGEADTIVFTSTSTVENFFNLYGDNALEVLSKVKPLAIGPVTKSTLEKMGVLDIHVAKKYNLEGIMDALLEM